MIKVRFNDKGVYLSDMTIQQFHNPAKKIKEMARDHFYNKAHCTIDIRAMIDNNTVTKRYEVRHTFDENGMLINQSARKLS